MYICGGGGGRCMCTHMRISVHLHVYMYVPVILALFSDRLLHITLPVALGMYTFH